MNDKERVFRAVMGNVKRVTMMVLSNDGDTAVLEVSNGDEAVFSREVNKDSRENFRAVFRVGSVHEAMAAQAPASTDMHQLRSVLNGVPS